MCPLNPVEHVFEALRTEINGIMYPTIDAKEVPVEAILAELDADRKRVTRLVPWLWIAVSLDPPPADNAA